MSINSSPVAGGKARSRLLEPEILVLQGASACAFLLSVGLLVLALRIPAYWLPGQLPRLIGLLWAVPAATVMTYRHAIHNAATVEAGSYLRRVHLARWAALGLALVALPGIQWHFQEHGANWFDGRLIWPAILSIGLCWCSGQVAEHLAHVWYLLRDQGWGEAGRIGRYDLVALHSHWGPIDRGWLIEELWVQWLLGSGGLAALVALHSWMPAHGQTVPIVWVMLDFLSFLVLGPVLIGQAVEMRWRSQWKLDRVTVAPDLAADWSQTAFTATLFALAGTGMLVGFFTLAHQGLVRLGSLLWAALTMLPFGFHVAPSPQPARAPAQAPVPPAQGVQTVPYNGGTGGGASHGGFGWTLPPIPSIVFLVLAFGLVAWAVWVARKQDRRGVSRWLLLAAMALELQAYFRWAVQRLGHWRMAGTRMASVPAPAVSNPQRHSASRATKPTELLPRQAIIALYQRALALAARRGFPLRAGQTPHEHAQSLGDACPDSGEQLRRLSDLFVAARYGDRPVAPDQVTRMEALWKALGRTLRRSRKR